jgi:hypothetical protein
MPLKTIYVKPSRYFTHEGISVYHAYKDRNYTDRLRYSYTTDVHERSEFEFDVRELSAYEPTLTHAAVIKAAIAMGEVTACEEQNG